MNSLEIATRNFLANQGLDEATIDLLAIDPDFMSRTAEFVAPFIAGPYGCLAPMDEIMTASGDELADDIDLIDACITSYVNALSDTIEHIDNSVIQVPCEAAAEAVHAVLSALKSDLQDEIDRIEGGNETSLDTDQLSDLFSFLFGGSVEVVELEPSEG